MQKERSQPEKPAGPAAFRGKKREKNLPETMGNAVNKKEKPLCKTTGPAVARRPGARHKKAPSSSSRTERKE